MYITRRITCEHCEHQWIEVLSQDQLIKCPQCQCDTPNKGETL